MDGGVAIANGEIGSGIIEKVTSEQKTGDESAVNILGASTLWLEGTDDAKALRWECA